MDADLLALVCDVKLCFFTLSCGILDQVWYLILSTPDLYHLSYMNASSKSSDDTARMSLHWSPMG